MDTIASTTTPFCCGLFPRRSTAPAQSSSTTTTTTPPPPPPRAQDARPLQGIEFSPRSSWASSTRAGPSAPAPAPAPEGNSTARSPPPANLGNPELAGYYSPPAPRPQVSPSPGQELRGYYAPGPAVARPGKPSYS